MSNSSKKGWFFWVSALWVINSLIYGLALIFSSFVENFIWAFSKLVTSHWHLVWWFSGCLEPLSLRAISDFLFYIIVRELWEFLSYWSHWAVAPLIYLYLISLLLVWPLKLSRILTILVYSSLAAYGFLPIWVWTLQDCPPCCCS